MPKKYSIESYDENLCLKINDTLWLILLYLLRPYVLAILSLLNKNDRIGIINMVYSDRLALWWGLLAGVPAILIVYAWSRRKPGASSFARSLWRRGRMLLAASAIFSVAIIFIPLWMGVVHRVNMVGWIQFVISLGVVVVLYTSTYIRDCFSDFPKDADADGSGVS